MSELPKELYSSTVYRCFNSVKPSQHLLDDIGLTESEQVVASDAYYEDELIGMKPHERVLHRAEYAIVLKNISSRFRPGEWMEGRFSDGTWPVLYSAESEATAITEKTYHMSIFYKEEARDQTIDVDLAVAKLNIHTNHLIDLSKVESLRQDLLRSKERVSYAYCQDIVQKCLNDGAEALRSFSARDETGFCVPILTPKIIAKDFGIRNWCKAEVHNSAITVYVGDKTFQW